VLAQRDSRPFATPLDLVTRAGMDRRSLTRPADEDGGGGPTASPANGGGPSNADDLFDPESVALIDLVTTFAAAADIQIGLGDGGASAGRRRIELGDTWTPELGAALDDRFGEGTGDAVRELIRQGVTFDRPSTVVGILQRLEVDAEDIGATLDAISMTPGPISVGRIDLNRAPAAVLATVPGINAEAAATIVDRRETLDEQRRLNVAWPVMEGVLNPAEFVQAVDWLSTRSLVWRVRIETGVEAQADDDDGAAAFAIGGGARSGDLSSVELRSRRVMDVVIDLAGDEPRLASIVDVTFAELAEQLAADSDIDAADAAAPGPREVSSVEALFAAAAGAAITPQAADPQREPELDPGESSPAQSLRADGPAAPQDADVPAESAPQDPRVGRWRASPKRGGS
jgi:hypothetical protein